MLYLAQISILVEFVLICHYKQLFFEVVYLCLHHFSLVFVWSVHVFSKCDDLSFLLIELLSPIPDAFTDLRLHQIELCFNGLDLFFLQVRLILQHWYW